MVKIFNIDLSEISGYVDDEENRNIRKQLKARGLYNKNCLYSVFNGRRKNQILETGNYRFENPDSIFALTKEELVWEAEIGLNNDIKKLSRAYLTPAIAVYNRHKFFQDFARGTNYEYFFRNPDKKLEALLGIAVLDIENLT